MTEADEQAVSDWATSNKISSDCLKQLIKDGFTSMEAIALLQPEDLSPKIPRGQHRLILAAVEKLNSDVATDKDVRTPPAVEERSTETPGDPYLREVLAQLQSAQRDQPQQPDQPRESAPSTLSWNDPQVFLKMASGKVEAAPYLDIVDFVNLSGAVIREEVVGSGSTGAQLVWRTGPKKPKLSSLTIPQWSVANLAIIARLQADGRLDDQGILDYLSYNTRIYQLLQRYEAVSVFLYDREYRKLQAQMGFRWGTEVTHLQAIWLKTLDQPTTSTGSRTVKQKGPATKEGKTICKLFNGSGGCSYADCKFVHVCSRPGCEQKHSAVQHDSKN